MLQTVKDHSRVSTNNVLRELQMTFYQAYTITVNGESLKNVTI